MKNLIVMLTLVVAVSGCSKDKDKDGAKKDPPSAPDDKPAPEVVTPDKPEVKAPDAAAAPADPTASWTEHKGAGFVVTAPRAPSQQSQTVPTPVGDQPVTFYTGYEPAGFQGAFQVAVSDKSGLVKDLSELDAKTVIDEGVKGLLATLPEPKVEKDEEIAGADPGRSVIASGNHPQGGPFTVSVSVYFRAGKIYMVQALYTTAADAPLGAKFVGSFKLVD